MIREITDHKTNGLNEAIEITAGEPGPGGAPHKYNLIGRGEHIPNIGPRPFGVNLRFQNGPIKGIEDMNGITNEALLAVLIDRMRGFQGVPPVHSAPEITGVLTTEPKDYAAKNLRAPFACRENAMALTHLEEALMWLQKRTLDRVKRGVEGSMAK
jgi:hypothetical protein